MILTVKSKTKPSILSLPESYASLADVTDSYYIYNVSYTINSVDALKYKAFTVNINIDNILGNQSTKPILVRNNDNNTIINNIRSQSSLLKAAILSIPDYVLTYKSDITSRLPNSENSRLLNLAAGINSATLPSKAIRTFTTQNVNTLITAGSNNPLMDINLNISANNDSSITINSQKIKSQSTTLLYKNGIDPASLIKNTNTIVPTSKTATGIIPKKSFTQNSILKNNAAAMNIVASHLSDVKMNLLSGLSKQSSVVVSNNISSQYVTITETVYIPVSKIGKNNFNIVFDLMTSSNRIFQSEKRFVSHGVNLTQLLLTESPSVKQLVSGTIGRAVFEVKQIDKYARGFFVYRRELNTTLSIKNAKYTQIAKINLLFGQSTFFEDRIATVNKVLYRFVPFADEDIMSSIFTSCIVSFNSNKIIKKNNINRRPIFVTIDPRMNGGQITVSISNITEEAIGLRLLKRDLSIYEKKFSIIASSILTHNTEADLKFNDGNVKPEHSYEYVVDLIFPNGQIARAPTNGIIEYLPITNNIAVTKINNLNITSYESLSDVTFDIEYSISETNFEFIKKLFSEQTLSTEYQEEITLNKSKLTTLLAYKVLRTNLNTGAVENFGIITDKKFSDRKFGLSRSVSNLDSSSEYVYTVITYMRNPETVLPDYKRIISTTAENIPVTYSLTPYKWRQPITLNNGNIVSTRTLQANHSKSELEQGTVVDIRYVPVSVVNILPTIETAQASKIKDNIVYIEWKVVGELEKIDHFIIKLNIHGMTTLIGTSHAISANKSFVFIDSLTNGEKGQLEYTIVPVYYDYAQGKSYKTNTVVI